MSDNSTAAERELTDSGATRISSGRRSRSSSSHNGHSRSARKIFKLKITVMLLSAALAITIFGWIATSINLSGIEKQFLEYQSNIREQVSNVENRSAELERLKSENEVLVKGILPGLKLLEYDTTVAIDDEYVRNIGFTLTGTSYNKNYEYRIVLHNDSLNVISPAVTLFLFDSRGIQVGTTILSKSDATSEVDYNTLQPNETRSYTGRVALNIQSEPKYFLVDVQ